MREEKRVARRSEASLSNFLELSNEEVAEIVGEAGRPTNVAVMMDGTRRMLKLQAEFRNDRWLYERDHISGLMDKSIDLVNLTFEMGVEVFMGPLASKGNLDREDFVPEGLERLLEPIRQKRALEVLKKHRAGVYFYGDLDYLKSLPGGEVIDDYVNFFQNFNQSNEVRKKVLVGLGFATDEETKLIADQAIEFFKERGRKPSKSELIRLYFGGEVPEIDIFIRTNELRASGGLTPLLTGHDTQFYFPASPGIVSMSEKTVKTIMYDYLFNRNISSGSYQHQGLSEEEAGKVRKFYNQNKDRVLGVGERVGDIWLVRDNY